MFIGSFSTKTEGRARVIEIVTHPGHIIVARLVIMCTGHHLGAVFCEDAEGNYNHLAEPPIEVFDRGDAYGHIAVPALQDWIFHHDIPPFYTVALDWHRDYYLELQDPNLKFMYRRLGRNPRRFVRPRVRLYFQHLSLITQIQVATKAIAIA
jgi:hypothetical protein